MKKKFRITSSKPRVVFIASYVKFKKKIMLHPNSNSIMTTFVKIMSRIITRQNVRLFVS